MDETKLAVRQKTFDLDKLDDKGRILYYSNKPMKDISNVMEHQEFKNFFELYFKDWTSVKAMVMLIKVYEQLNDNFEDLNGHQRLAMVYDIIGDSDLRPSVVSKMSEWIEREEQEKNRVYS